MNSGLISLRYHESSAKSNDNVVTPTGGRRHGSADTAFDLATPARIRLNQLCHKNAFVCVLQKINPSSSESSRVQSGQIEE